MINLCELVRTGKWEIEGRSNSNIIGINLGELLHLSHSWDDFDLGDGDLLFGYSLWSFGVIFSDIDDEAFFVGIKLVKEFLIINEFEWLRPIVFISVSHCVIIINSITRNMYLNSIK